MQKLTKKEVAELIADAHIKQEEHPELRFTQAAYILLYGKNRLLALCLNEKNADPFYVRDENRATDQRWINFLKEISEE